MLASLNLPGGKGGGKGDAVVYKLESCAISYILPFSRVLSVYKKKQIQNKGGKYDMSINIVY